ncbi:hypothetical protein A4H97_24285 [Niastella yeongjuensis]|uniref:PA14 domain-containing protein n=1 Tax=Niastella yeongjuensis TaxID=354355 RepID=A0A1V9F3A9_9BACT|nr:hypothetical protein [Niastella yeongjuensis]OQP52821.1 hypothetical protein A4H97_24285 [Niastella yeongjuensis]SEP20523.1 hypothetical protein SAMN05660816_04745 [Niastella yeongjuensis]
MLQTLARHPKFIAWFFVGIFYLQLVLVPLAAKANVRPLPARMPLVESENWKIKPAEPHPFTNKIDHNMPVKLPATIRHKRANSSDSTQEATTTGPTQPETQSFQSVNNNNLVDLFTGDFSYNIPLLDVGGYPVNLHYQSGITMDQEASWVGLGWNINPGVVSRNMRGLPDDFMGPEDSVKKIISIKPNRTMGVAISANAELLGFSKVGASLGIFHNTYQGWGTEFGLNANINAGSAAKGPLSAGLGITNNSQTGLDVSPSLSVKMGKEDAKTKGNITIGTNYNSRVGLQSLQMCGEVRQSMNDNKKGWTAGVSHTMAIGFAKPSYTPTINIPYTSGQFSLTVKGGSEHWAFHPNFYIRGYTSMQKIEEPDKIQDLPAYGYLYYDKAGNNRHVLLDFNREKDVPFTDNSPHIAVPIYTYDTWSISGEGTGGSFRAYRGDIGYVFDHSMSTKSDSKKFSLDLGFGAIFHGGIDFNSVDALTKTNPWEADNSFTTVVPFKQTDTSFESVYFKNPGEKNSVNKAYLQAIGNDSLMRVDLSPAQESQPSRVLATTHVSLFQNARAVASRTLNASSFKKTRDKRTQVISYLNAKEADYVGFDRVIKSYHINSFPSTSCTDNYDQLPRIDNNRKLHHLSEITVLNADGRRYVYGIPVYNRMQTEVSMSTLPGSNSTGLVQYTKANKSIENTDGKDGYYNRETLPPYAHSFLLSGILSNDYVDITGDGISEDDNGDAVKFNYTRIYDLSQTNTYRWRAPYQDSMAFYNEGLKTDSRDERGSFTYGEREVWYLNSIESKTMIATFVLETDSTRQDSYGVKSEDGGRDASQKLYRLKQINLYTKADFLKNGSTNAKPIKTVHFDYNYELCKKNPGSLSDSGKLTLKKVWFSYNKNNKGKKNPYVFTYNATNPEFSQKSVDRWGNYKNPGDNPGPSGQELSNADYPYALQDSTKATNNAAPWTLSQIKLPSGALLKVTYESDDYAYVQNRRAMQFFAIAGFGNDANATISSKLYTDGQTNSDYHYVFINVPTAVNSKADIASKYLDGVSQLFFKLAVNVPADRWGKGFEFIPVYCEIEDYGVRTFSSNKTIWIKVKSIKSNESPFATAALQFLRMNLQSKAYPFSEPGDNLDIKSLMGMFASIADNVKNTVNSFSSEARKKNWCNSIVVSKSFARLDNPVYKKLGGGLRVKKVEVYDNWNKMTGQLESKYGQTYTYTDTTQINGVKTCISSGVASYEPMIGNDENPFRVPQKLYTEKVGALIPADYMYTEEPFAETFFPAPIIGYGKVSVQSIHKDKKSANGFEETEFYTSKDFPVLIEYTPIDNESKKTYDPKIRNFLNFYARHYVTLSQGFKIELNDMNGKLKAQASYSQNDLGHPISYTYNYYRVKNDNAAQARLSNTVAAIDSANGKIDTTAEMGKEVELMIDVREETSNTVSKSLEVNGDFVHPFPPIAFFTGIPLPSMETNRYRAIAVLKIVNRYGLLDSVIHIEKGSRVTTRNLVYDGETGDVLVTQTNNEFDDPVYNFNYPAHWAYSGMGPAYKNIGVVMNGVYFRNGTMYDSVGNQVQADRYFESGDELLVVAKDFRDPRNDDYCSPDYYRFANNLISTRKLWAVDISKVKQGKKGIYFIDRDGIPYSSGSASIKIVRSGKRNMPGVPVGNITSLHSPIKRVNNIPRIVFDSTTGVVAASAARFKDLWKVDSTTYARDTLIYVAHKMDTGYQVLNPVENITISKGVSPLITVYVARPNSLFEAFSQYHFPVLEERKSWLKFNFASIPQSAIIKSATLNLYGSANSPHSNMRSSNACYIERLKGIWPSALTDVYAPGVLPILRQYFNGTDFGIVETGNRVTLGETMPNTTEVKGATVDITSMAKEMLDDYYSSFIVHDPAIRISLIDPGGLNNGNISSQSYKTNESGECPSSFEFKVGCLPSLTISYYLPCQDNTPPFYSSTPDPGYYCSDFPVDSFVCKPNINDTAVNYYRFGILGNWRMDRVYTYYSKRVQSNPADTTNVRSDGEIKDFAPYWSFTNALMTASMDTTRWVWNSETTLFNSKGYEIENHDPLNRYNAGQYGYNQSLPVVVAQNARNQEIAYEGFEDYGYKTDTCKRCDVNRHINLGAGNTLVDSVSHSGKYSLRVPGEQTVSKIYKLGNATDILGSSPFMKEDSIVLAVHPRAASGTGTGLTGIASPCSGTSYNTNVDFPRGVPFPGSCTGANTVEWNGYIQPRYTGTYQFWGTVNFIMSVQITRNGVVKNLTAGTLLEVPHVSILDIPTDTIELQAGELYEFRVVWTLGASRVNQIQLSWSSEGLQPQNREVVPIMQLYPVGTDISAVRNSTVTSDTTWCTHLKNPTVTRGTIKRFSPLPGKKVIVSAWVKEEGQCITGSYENAQLNVAFDNEAGTNLFQLKPAGNIIEGWQRIEDTLTIPYNATNITLSMVAVSGTPVYFDDIRIQPFNANVKSFVYNPVNLRLMAELDENNYATFYEYDDDGTLVRVKKETERGIKTIKETRSALLKNND